MFKRADMEGRRESDGLWAGREFCLCKKAPTAPLATRPIPSVYLGCTGREHCRVRPVAAPGTHPGLGNLARTHLSTLIGLKVCAPLCLSAS